jgi:hypothetical protein
MVQKIPIIALLFFITILSYGQSLSTETVQVETSVKKITKADFIERIMDYEKEYICLGF